jgi:hypothetical protein
MHFDGNYTALWQAALAELQLQMAQATFGHLQGSQAIGAEDGTLSVAVRTAHAQEWLQGRLGGVVGRTVERLAGRPLVVQFVVAEAGQVLGSGQAVIEEAETPAFVVPEFDVHEAGWFPVSEYECRFWAPLLRRIGWRVWEIVRKADTRKRKTSWTPTRRWTAPALAEMVPCGRQAITGVNRRCEEGRTGARQDGDGVWWHYQPGAFDRLVAEAVARIERRGEMRHTTYLISVRVKLGLVGPEQVGRLPARLQVEHDEWLADHGFDPAAWDEG